MRAEVFQDLEALDRHVEAWDALAVANGRPYCSPHWLLSWWRHEAPEGARLAVVAIFDRNELTALAPLFVQGNRYRLLAGDASLGVEPLAASGVERESIELAAATLAAAEPRPGLVELAGVRAESPWPHVLRETWPGRRRPILRRELSMPLPMLELAGLTYEEWFASKSAHFRQRARHLHRALVDQGGQVRLADGEEDVEHGLQEFARLHHARWRSRGGSGVLTPGVERMLSDAARELAVGARFRLWLVEVEGRVIGAGVRLAAGGEISNWLASFDEAWRNVNAPLLMMVAEIEDSLARGDRRIDLGGGRAELKSRVADHEDLLETFLLLPPGARRPFIAASLLPGRLRRAVGARLPRRAKTALKRVLRR